MDTDQIADKLRHTLKHRRFVHSIGVAYTAASLAMCHDPHLADKSFRAGLLHDCAKFMDTDATIDYCREHDIKLSEYEEATPSLIHAKTGVFIARHEYDEHVLVRTRQKS